MVTASSKTAAHRKKKPQRKRRSRREELVTYILRVTGWNYYYSLRPSDPKNRWDSGPYSELATLTFFGDVIRPEDTKYAKASVTLSARTHMMEEKILPPPSVGTLNAGGNELSTYIFVPQERLAELASIAQSERVRIVALTGTKLKYRSASVTRLAVSTEEDEEEW